MKNLARDLAICVFISALFSGCGQKPSDQPTGNQLTASDLALLTDFHAWKGPIPESQQPVKRIRLVIVKRDGTTISKFDTGDNLGRGCVSILLGIRVDRGVFTGQLKTRDSKGGGLGWALNFTDAFAESDPAWSIPGTLVWSGNRAQLAVGTKDGEMRDSVLALELVK